MRGPFTAIKTNVPGIEISEIFSQDRAARGQVHDSALGLSHRDGGPRHGHQMMQTGRLFSAGSSTRTSAARWVPRAGGELPAHALLPPNRPHRRQPAARPLGGYLGKPHDPFILNADPNAPGFKVPDLLPPDYITGLRNERRQKLREAVDGTATQGERRRSNSTTTSS